MENRTTGHLQGRTRMTTPRRALLTATALTLLLAAGWLLPRHLLSDGVDRHAASAERTVAAEALDLATAELVAIVRTHGPFGVPLRSMRASCGGQAITC